MDDDGDITRRLEQTLARCDRQFATMCDVPSGSNAWVSWLPPRSPFDHDEGFVVVGVAGDIPGPFWSLGAALDAATAVADHVTVRIDDLGEWELPLAPAQHDRIETFVAARRERHECERRTYEHPVEWFVAFLDPATDAQLEELAQLIAQTPEVVSCSVRRRAHHGTLERWLVVRVQARSIDDACTLASDVASSAMWPADLPRRVGIYAVGTHQIAGLAQYEEATLA